MTSRYRGFDEVRSDTVRGIEHCCDAVPIQLNELMAKTLHSYCVVDARNFRAKAGHERKKECVETKKRYKKIVWHH